MDGGAKRMIEERGFRAQQTFKYLYKYRGEQTPPYRIVANARVYYYYLYYHCAESKHKMTGRRRRHRLRCVLYYTYFVSTAECRATSFVRTANPAVPNDRQEEEEEKNALFYCNPILISRNVLAHSNVSSNNLFSFHLRFFFPSSCS